MAICLAFFVGFSPILLVLEGHPSGHLEINHFTRLEVGVGYVKVDYLVTADEISTFQELRAFGIQNVDSPTGEELDRYLHHVVHKFGDGLYVSNNDQRVRLRLVSRRFAMSQGPRGFNTLRIECEFFGETKNSTQKGRSNRLRFEDRNHGNRRGWYELVAAAGAGVTVFNSSAFANGVTDRLRIFPANAQASPLQERIGELYYLEGRAPPGAEPLRTRKNFGLSRGIDDALPESDLATLVLLLGLVVVTTLPIIFGASLLRAPLPLPDRHCYYTLLPACLVLALLAVGSRQDPLCRVTVSLVNEDTGDLVPGVIRVSSVEDHQPVSIENLIPRGQGIGGSAAIHDWYALPRRAEIALPPKRLRLDAFSGLESQLTSMDVDLTGIKRQTLRVPLRFFRSVQKQGWYAGNTHLHLRGFSLQQAERYLTEVPLADRLDVLFISHAQRPGADHDYTTNRFAIGEFAQGWNTSVLLNNGEEHRNNFGPTDEGFGHVMLLNIKRRIDPVSIGPGINGSGNDGIPLQAGIEEAHRQGGRAIWCHNSWGLEDVPNFVTGKLDALNIFDGGSVGSYEDSFYRYLNAGLRVPFSTGTDWFISDLARAYTRVGAEPTISSWLQSLASGRTFITNGPLLEFTVQGKQIGDTVHLEGPVEIAVHGRADGRLNFGKLQLIKNGMVISEADVQSLGGRFQGRLNERLLVTEPCWLALRVSGGAPNEYGRPLFGHTSPIFVHVAGKRFQDSSALQHLIRDMEQAMETIAARGVFNNTEDLQRVMQVYKQAIDQLTSRQH